MTKNPKLSFKKEARMTGLSSIANPYPPTRIKSNKAWVGTIYPPSRFGGDNWRPALAVKSDESDDNQAGFRWATFKGHETEAAARQWVVDRWDALCAKYVFHELD